MIKRLLFLFCYLYFNLSFSQQTSDNKSTRVSILTVGTADESHSLYGHTALRIKDSLSGIDMVYNYGMFDFNTENFILKFIKGDLQYYAAAYPYTDFEYNYRLENRSIYEQILNLSLQEKQTIYNKLNTTLYTADRYYTYKFIDRNCTTKVIDIVNEALESKPITKQNTDSKTYRDVLFPYVENHFYQKLGINIIFGQKVDNTATKLFLPFDLYDNLKLINYKSKPLVTQTKTLFEANRKTNFSFFDNIYSLIGVLLFLLIFNKKTTNVIYFSTLGLIGLLLSGIGLYSLHKEVLWNYNILLFNPLFLILAYFILTDNTKWTKKTSWICLVTTGTYMIYMFTKIHLIIMLPLIATSLIGLTRLIFQSIDPTENPSFPVDK
jgi:hypothetical protein